MLLITKCLHLLTWALIYVGFPPATSQSDTTVESIKQEDKEELPANNSMINPESVITKFLNIKAQLDKLLQSCDLIPITDKCTSLLASEGHKIPLFPTDYTEKLKRIEHFHELLLKLSPFITWDNHSILNTIAETSNISHTITLLTQFDDRIDVNQSLTRFPIPTPSHTMIPYDNSTHTILAVKLDINLDDCTLQDVIDVRLLIQDQCNLTSFCFNLLAVAKSNNVTVYWMMPKNITHLITVNAVKFQNYFYEKGILELSIYPGIVHCTGNVLKVGSLSFFNQIYLDGKQVRIPFCSTLLHSFKSL